ncbi:MAG: hypothetical protein JXA10_10740 [Anaerolineae bacterium]|nr:hypothetical protein [Anaerolineae bacterium]
MANEIYMNVPEVEKVAQGFSVASDILRAVSKALQALLQLLKAVAFMGLVGGQALQSFIEWVKPKIDDMAEYCEEISNDVKFAIEAYVNGDEAGATRFH